MSVVNQNDGEPKSFVSVIRLVNHYIAVYSCKNKRTFISKHPETDIKVAQLTAEAFAKSKNVPYFSDFFELDRPIITIWKQGSDWYPAELHPDRMVLLTNLEKEHFDRSQHAATKIACRIAVNQGTDFWHHRNANS